MFDIEVGEAYPFIDIATVLSRLIVFEIGEILMSYLPQLLSA
jgi:hypothetical protein